MAGAVDEGEDADEGAIAVGVVDVAGVAPLRSQGFGGDAMVNVCREKIRSPAVGVEGQKGLWSGYPPFRQNMWISYYVIVGVTEQRQSYILCTLLYGFTRSGSSHLVPGVVEIMGRTTMDDFFTTSVTGTASSNSNARTSTNRTAFILCRDDL